MIVVLHTITENVLKVKTTLSTLLINACMRENKISILSLQVVKNEKLYVYISILCI